VRTAVKEMQESPAIVSCGTFLLFPHSVSARLLQSVLIFLYLLA